MDKQWEVGATAVVDRIEDGIAVLELEDETMMEFRTTELPSEIKEGFVVRYNGEQWEIDMDAYEQKLADMEALFHEFF